MLTNHAPNQIVSGRRQMQSIIPDFLSKLLRRSMVRDLGMEIKRMARSTRSATHHFEIKHQLNSQLLMLVPQDLRVQLRPFRIQILIDSRTLRHRQRKNIRAGAEGGFPGFFQGGEDARNWIPMAQVTAL